MVGLFKRRRIRKAREAILSRRAKREGYTRAIVELTAFAVRAIDTPNFENRGKIVRECLVMIADKTYRLRRLK